ncbi:hypothetical protein TRIUR3_10640 [Triticum urartu]|uniref:Uncharacterized protein n=2 Tax=Triticum TaxID=4564 RepID=A0A9R0TE33_TRITD|nr:hypothetical protein TRIUR3_10640 [Triticum urartu]VAI12153.1 unnamed protein product [Triticum turgidum subsp. durum]
MGQEEDALTVAFSWEQELGMPESPRKPPDDPFLAAYLACTKSGGDGDGRKMKTAPTREAKGQRRWSGLGRGLGALSCKRSNGVVEQSMGIKDVREVAARRYMCGVRDGPDKDTL